MADNSPTYSKLADAIRDQIQRNTELLGLVLDLWAKSGGEDKTDDALDDLVPVTEIETATGGKITVNRARWLARNRKQNGLADAFTKVGRTLYIDLRKFRVWLSSQGGGHAT